jgi:hypothetical protein
MASPGTTEFLTDREIYRRVILEMVPQARSFLWLATADLKDLYIERRGRFVPFLKQVAELLEAGIEVRLLHAKEPGPNFRTDFDRFPVLIARLERVLCPRVHFKSVVVDGSAAYSGSANLTGAGRWWRRSWPSSTRSGWGPAATPAAAKPSAPTSKRSAPERSDVRTPPALSGGRLQGSASRGP